MDLNDQHSHIHDPVMYLIEKRHELQINKINAVQQHMTDMLKRITDLIGELNHKLNYVFDMCLLNNTLPIDIDR
mgnify:FL=1